MKTNIGSKDRVVRTMLAAVTGILYFTGVIDGTFAIIAGIVSIIFVITSFTGFCPVYALLNIRTSKTKL